MDYSDRKITKIEVISLKRGKEVDGTAIVRGDVNVYISAFDGSDFGPNLQASVAVRIGDNPTVAEAEQALLDATLGLIKRIAQETPESFQQRTPDPLRPAD